MDDPPVLKKLRYMRIAPESDPFHAVSRLFVDCECNIDLNGSKDQPPN